MGWRSDLDPARERALNAFLAEIEGRAFRIAQLATGNRDDALELVQEAMMKLVQRYADRSADEWRALFHSILQSRIRDWYRRQSVRNRLRSWFPWNDDDAAESPIDRVAADSACEPPVSLEGGRFAARLNAAVGALSQRQQQAFLLRSWEGLDVAQTAAAMGCSAGSVKTHHARAVEKLRAELEDYRE